MFSSNLDKRWRWSAGASAVLFAMLMTSGHGARAGNAPVTGQGTVKKAITVDLRTAAKRPAVPKPPALKFNRPTPRAGAVRSGPLPPSRRKAGAAHAGPGDALSLLIAVPSVNENIGGGFPPDGDIATSPGFTVQINNFVLTMYNLNSGTLVAQPSFATFFNDGTDFLFDPRIIYDPLWNRFVALVDAQSPGGQSFLELAVSQTADPTGAWFVFTISTSLPAGDFFDFPQMGMDLNSIIITFNDFEAGGGFDAKTFSFAKAYAYNGAGFGFPIFGGSGCTIAPPYVLDNAGLSYTLVACPGDNKVFLGPISNSGLSNVSVNHWQATVGTVAFGTPPCAPQPGVDYCLDTLDSRFENRSAQIGNEIWNVNVVNASCTIPSGCATPSWYEFDTNANTLLGSSLWFASGTSSDWHPSIVVNGVGGTGGLTGETFGTWMSVDATNNINLQLQAIGGSDGNAGGGAGIAVGPASAFPLTNQTFNGNRSGDYSYISLYPAPALGCSANEIAILEGEVSDPAFSGTEWLTEVGIVKHC